MNTMQKPEAQRLADTIERLNAGVHSQAIVEDYTAAARELRRQHDRIVELESQLKESTCTAKKGDGRWLTVVYRDIQPGDEAHAIADHPKVSAISWSHALHDRDAALADVAKQGAKK